MPPLDGFANAFSHRKVLIMGLAPIRIEPQRKQFLLYNTDVLGDNRSSSWTLEFSGMSCPPDIRKLEYVYPELDCWMVTVF